ncbi:isopenicillin N synthase family oxygenase [Roseobacter sp. HKCCD9010]|uniref:isopenicillin N synthase family dioxygenase n=1 Tax=unclassified Roseobacter TaxID=196798 RepID=UPI0014919225|nr:MULTISPECIES: isopenicillin N synthase family oxygenase [unclassified Roseobacter]MBF9048792.1 isopenicillin N synthase family oxygenase [Rhodobacterales bacterium HKCCD4356]NNV10791.1 isopenicillin N synthase family oxygenase [Roseobacter sp. HKCCD7357]NNV14976.1 isopenicillin N synthase family oxygenase [Roseobacter sp. HKCCD8768]NNV24435.1 isopenicillin N synthase family oxygenase [Roseobacter sp. HKCCD8192]NNV28692.1 isopenicillin N synthase family oxygenase [Roseobacter sp. HKCCD9061]
MIPILDWQRFASGQDRNGFVADLGIAARQTGFFLLKGHGVDLALQREVFDKADQFFALPPAEKESISILKTPHYRGWAYDGLESLDEASGMADRKESFNMGLDLPADDPRVLAGDPFRGVNQWPDLPGFRKTMLRYYDAALALGVKLHRAIALDLGLPEHHFDSAFIDPLAALRVLHYPPGRDAKNEIGAGAHTDYGAITLLMTNGEPGLQVKPRGGDWIDVPHVASAYVVNIGDCLMRWTNDIYVSTPHRVLRPKNQRRSVAFFVEANPDVIVEALPGTGAPKYPAIRAADYLQSRLDVTYNAPVPKS